VQEKTETEFVVQVFIKVYINIIIYIFLNSNFYYIRLTLKFEELIGLLIILGSWFGCVALPPKLVVLPLNQLLKDLEEGLEVQEKIETEFVVEVFIKVYIFYIYIFF